jgi:NADH:ubiquinone oxidoreductase subunit E
MELFDKSTIDNVLVKYQRGDGSLISVLQGVQGQCGYLPKEALQYVSQKLELPLSKLFSVATFYHSFSLEPRGKNKVSVCLGTACHVKGGENLMNKLARELKLEGGEGTTTDQKFTVEKVRCLGCCSIAPVLRVNEDTYGQVTQNKVDKILRKYEKA